MRLMLLLATARLAAPLRGAGRVLARTARPLASARGKPLAAAPPIEPEEKKVAPLIPIELEDEMEDCFMKYALSTILGRALPDARDGLKPVHRRILYGMRGLGLQPTTPFRKCARVVGEVLGKYHPHGDGSVYDALVRMAQDFVMSTRMVDGHGNFGSVDNDPPAAMRYTECRLTKFSAAALLNSSDLGKPDPGAVRNGGIAVSMFENFDGSEYEPDVLPARCPVLLVNGAAGIAVGMATMIPPHNLGEVCDAALLMARAAKKNETADDDALSEALPAPDFPTGGLILGTTGVARAYASGSGSIVVRGRTSVEKVRSGRTAIVATELPYLVSKSDLLEKTAEAVNSKRLLGIADLRDESDRDGMRVVYELKRDANPQVVLSNLFKSTRLQTTYAANMVAVDAIRDEHGVEDPQKKAPVRLTLRSALERWLRFRFDCVRRRAAHEEARAAARLHIVQGLVLAQANADAVVKLVRAATSPEEARAALVKGSAGLAALSEDQARAVLALTLSRLTSLAANELAKEQADLEADLERLGSLRNEDAVVYDAIVLELLDVKKRFAVPRRTQLVEEEDAIEEEDVIENDRSAVLVSRGGYMKRTSLKEFAAQARGGRGRRAAPLAVAHLCPCRDHDTMLCISDAGVAYGVRAFHVPAAARTARGAVVASILPVDEERTVAGLIAVDTAKLNDETVAGADELFVVVLMRSGVIKRTPLSSFRGLTSRGLIAVRLAKDDAVHSAALCTLQDSLVIATARGRALRYDAGDVRETGRATRGVKALSLREDDELVAMDVVPPSKTHVLLLTAQGYGKRVKVDDLRVRSRTSAGVQAIKFRGEDRLVGVRGVDDDDEVLMITEAGVVVRQSASGVSVQSRAATGVRVQAAGADDECAFLSVVPPDVQLPGFDEDGEA